MWDQQALTQRFPPLGRDLEVDVCVVGAGISGLSTAYRLAKEGLRVAVLESRVRGAGMTGASLRGGGRQPLAVLARMVPRLRRRQARAPRAAAAAR